MPELIPTKYILRFLLVFGLGFSLIGVGIVLFAGLPIVRDAQASLAWPQTTGRVIESEVVMVLPRSNSQRVHDSHQERIRRNSLRDIKYTAKVVYQYEVDGAKFEGDNVLLGKWSSSSRSDPQQVAQRYPVGDEVTVFYQPDDAGISVLEPGITRGADIYFLIGGIFAGAGLLVACIPLVVWMWLGWSAKPKESQDRFV